MYSLIYLPIHTSHDLCVARSSNRRFQAVPQWNLCQDAGRLSLCSAWWHSRRNWKSVNTFQVKKPQQIMIIHDSSWYFMIVHDCLTQPQDFDLDAVGLPASYVIRRIIRVENSRQLGLFWSQAPCWKVNQTWHSHTKNHDLFVNILLPGNVLTWNWLNMWHFVAAAAKDVEQVHCQAAKA